MNTENTWVFLSHSNMDFPKLTIVRDKLEALGYRPLLFFLKCLEDDKEIRALIYREIDARERFILCRSENSEKSDWVKEEVKYIESLRRPYEVIDLEASDAAIDAAIKDFNQRSTAVLCSTENAVAKETVDVLEAKAFKVINLNERGYGGTSLSIQGIKNYVKKNRDIFEKAYFIVLVSRKLREEETEFLNGLVGDYELNAFVFNVERYADKGYFAGLKSFKTLEGDMNKCMAEKIVRHLIDWDVSHNNKKIEDTGKDTSRNGDDGNVIETKKPRIKNDVYLARLKDYLEAHRETVLAKTIDKASHKTWLKDNNKESYISALGPKCMRLINTHASRKGQYYSTIYECTDLKILCWIFDDLLSKQRSVEAQEVYYSGTTASALRCYIMHLLKENGITI